MTLDFFGQGEEMVNEVEKEKTKQKTQKGAKRVFEIFVARVCPFPLCWQPLFSLFRLGLPSLPWFFLSLFKIHLFLPSLPWFFLSLFIVHPFLPSLPRFFLSIFIILPFLL